MNDDVTCPHVCKVPDALNTYSIILAYYVTCIAEDSEVRKAKDVKCHYCNFKRRIHACLECAYFGCFKQEIGKVNHMKFHALESSHCLFVNINYGSIFCFKCNDYIYNETFDNTLKEFKLEAAKMADYPCFVPWTPNLMEIERVRNKLVKISDRSYIGLRGIVNIGNSCYINCVIQVLMHTAVLRDFFLSDQHVCVVKECLPCSLFKMYQEFYSGISFPYDPTVRFFGVLQNYTTASLGLEQNDCYELFQEILFGMHDSCKCLSPKESEDCNCVIHQIFYGINQGYKKCSNCNASSLLPHEYYMDILLNQNNEKSLVQMLDKKYSEKVLLHDLTCTTCNATNTTYLYQSIKKLPKVICLRINCFVSSSKSKNKSPKFTKKKSNFKFEEWIEMTPYLHMKDEVKNSHGDIANNIYAFENKYCLYAIIVHKGSLEFGHYFCFVRRQMDKWFKCDDSKVYEQTLQEVMREEPFLLFYFKHP